jgi:hypothetical protein
MDQQVVGMMLQQFYDKTQVMVGEAIAVSQLQKFIDEKRNEVGLGGASNRRRTTKLRAAKAEAATTVRISIIVSQTAPAMPSPF